MRAQQTLYERYAARMYRICFRYVREELQAEDLLISGFMKVFNRLDQFEYRNDGSLEAWIKKIMVNESLMYLRKRYNFNLVTEAEAHHLEADTTLESQLAAEEIYALILGLPTGYRTVFNLFVIEGYSHQEIAEQLNISENTSKSQLSKARAALRNLLLQHGFTHENGRTG